METSVEQINLGPPEKTKSQEQGFFVKLRRDIADKYRTFIANITVPVNLSAVQYMDIEIICRLAMAELEEKGRITGDRAAEILYMNGLSVMDLPEEQLPENFKFKLWLVMQENNMKILVAIAKRAGELTRKKQQKT